MKQFLTLSLLLLFIFSSCKKDEEETFIDELESTYSGVYEVNSCNVPITVISTTNSTVEINKQSETEVAVSIKNSTGETMDFNGVITSDSTFSIDPFIVDSVEYKGIGKKVDKLEIFLGDGCTFAGNEIAIGIFTEN